MNWHQLQIDFADDRASMFCQTLALDFCLQNMK